MIISLEMLLTSFEMKYPHTKTLQKAVFEQIQGVKLLPGKTNDLSSDYLYVTDNHRAADLNGIGRQIPLLCFCQSPEDGIYQSNITLILTDDDLADCLNALQQCYQDFTEWERNMENAIYQDAPLQYMIDISEDFLRSPVLIYDPSLKLNAYAKNYSNIEDPIFRDAVEKGYLSNNVRSHFAETQRLSQLEVQDISIEEADAYHNHPDIIKAIFVRNQLMLYCVMLHTEDISRTYAEGIFRAFCENLQRLEKKRMTDLTRARSVSDYFLMDLLDNPDTPTQTILDRMSYSNLDYNGNYITIVVRFSVRNHSQENLFLQQLRSNLIHSNIFVYRDNIVILYNLPVYHKNNYRSYLSGRFKAMDKELKKRKASLSFSRPFPDLSYFYASYIQAVNAFDINNNDNNSLCLFFEDHWEQDLFKMNSSKDLMFSYCEPALLDLISHPSDKTANQLKILQLYLSKDRKVSDVAEALNMHRNNVIYHIRKIEGTYQLDFDDPETRLHFLLSFELLRHLGKI